MLSKRGFCHCPLVHFKLGIWVLENDKRSFSHTSKFVDASYCKYWARCKLEGLMDGLRYGANGTFVSINLVSRVLMGSISMLELELILLRACQPLFRLVCLRALQSLFFTFCLNESKLNLDLLIFDFLLDLWLFSASSASSVFSVSGRIN